MKKTKSYLQILITLLIALVVGCAGESEPNRVKLGTDVKKPEQSSPVEKITPEERDVYDLVLLGARDEVKRGVNTMHPTGTSTTPAGTCRPGWAPAPTW